MSLGTNYSSPKKLFCLLCSDKSYAHILQREIINNLSYYVFSFLCCNLGVFPSRILLENFVQFTKDRNIKPVLYKILLSDFTSNVIVAQSFL